MSFWGDGRRTEARDLTRRQLEEQPPRRWGHVQVVAAEAARLAAGLRLARWPLVTAAWLHDIGYA